MNDLTVIENQRLDQLEDIVSKNLRAYYEVGIALLEIRESRLYRNGYETFEDYCRDRWDMGINYSEKIMNSAKVIDNLKSRTNGTTQPQSERQTRPLTRLSAPLQIEAWKKAVETAPEGKITAKHIEAVVVQVTKDEGGEKKQKKTKSPRKIWGNVFNKIIKVNEYIDMWAVKPPGIPFEMVAEIVREVNKLTSCIDYYKEEQND